MSDDETPPYRVVPREGGFAVEGPDGHVLMETRDELVSWVEDGIKSVSAPVAAAKKPAAKKAA